MKKIYKMIALILCIAAIVMLAGCSKSTYQGGDDSGKAVTSGDDGGNGKQVGKDRLSQDGVEYLVANGKLTISGNGTVTKDAVAAMLPEYNIVDFESGNLIKKVKSLIPLLVPLFISAFRRANDLAMAMEARCYRGGDHRTKMKPLIYKRRDYLAYVVLLIYLVLCVVLGNILL